MRNVLLFMFGIGLLTACSDEVYLDDRQNNDQKEASTSNGSGTYATYSDDGNYQSVWNIYTRGQEMYYRYENRTGDMGHPGRLNFTITPYIGLAYYDGTNDGV